jgi:hypothetical protein
MCGIAGVITRLRAPSAGNDVDAALDEAPRAGFTASLYGAEERRLLLRFKVAEQRR